VKGRRFIAECERKDEEVSDVSKQYLESSSYLLSEACFPGRLVDG